MKDEENYIMNSAVPEQINLLTHTMDQISKATDNEKINSIIEKLFMDFTGSDFASLLIFNKHERLLYGGRKRRTIKISMIAPEGLLGKCFLTKEAAVYNHTVSEKNYISKIDNPNNDKLRSLLLVPVLEDDTLIGIICTSKTVYNKKKYTNYDLNLLKSLSPFLIKIIHILTSSHNSKYPLNVNATEVVADLKKIGEQTSDESSTDKTLLFLSNTIHDIRTPANSLYGFLELIEEQTEDKRMKGFIENAKESAEFINTLIDTILDNVKYKNKAHTSKSTIINTVKFFAQNANIFTANMFNKEIRYLVHIDPLIPKQIKIDTVKLKRVIINLIGNAYKFTPKGKQINFSVKFDHKHQTLKISVKDKGIGIEEHRQKEIFEAFKQIEVDMDDQIEGTGLGLAICANYVNKLGGKLKLKSALDKGSKFHFFIPVEVIDSTPAYEKFYDLKKEITILTDQPEHADVENISQYITELGMPSVRITVSDTIDYGTTHLFCFQHKLTPDVLSFSRQQQIQLTVVEEALFSLNKNPHFSQLDIMSQNTYYGDIVHNNIFSGEKIKILIADDNKINIMLLKAMMETEYCNISIAMNGEEALGILKDACYKDDPFDIVFLDRNMPVMSGSEVMRDFREFEQEIKTKPLFSISITGDPGMDAEEKGLYNLFVNKPFKKQDVIKAMHSLNTH